MTHHELIDYLDRVISGVKTDIEFVKQHTNKNSVHLSWGIAHLQVTALDYIRDIERYKKYLLEE